jgi:S1-C subfamily serine protease
VKRIPLYSSSRRPREAVPASPVGGTSPVAAAARPVHPIVVKWRGYCNRHERAVTLFASAVIAVLVVVGHATLYPAPRQLEQKDIDAAVLHTVENNVLPSEAARAYEAIRGSVVHVRGSMPLVDPGKGNPRGNPRRGKDVKSDKDDDVIEGVGTGVVIIDKGIILTNLHVVHGFQKITVTFADGSESDAFVTSTAPQHDLAVLRAMTVPDDLVAATLRSTHDLRLGDRVIAVGFPFGIGPSLTSGVVSGLRREYRSPQGKRLLTNLIQFDAAANPGNSGGPLVTADGEVVGIVTGILNPSGQGVFIGIGFAVPIENAASAVGISPF